jgi:hypothetical protein
MLPKSRTAQTVACPDECWQAQSQVQIVRTSLNCENQSTPRTWTAVQPPSSQEAVSQHTHNQTRCTNSVPVGAHALQLLRLLLLRLPLLLTRAASPQDCLLSGPNSRHSTAEHSTNKSVD